jgi:UDP-N-acetyl-2-amino-2-deoxyglucuronate dehydrogenase
MVAMSNARASSGVHRVAIVGCGSIAAAHAYGVALAARERGDVELVGLADLHLDAAVGLGSRFGVPATACFDDYRLMLDTLRPDVVYVAVWHGQHAEVTIAAAARGARLVVCEKPMAATLGDADAMLVACRREHVKLVISHQRRFFPGWTVARELIASGTIGRPQHVRLQVRDGLLNSATHSVDLARYVLGDPETVGVVAAVQRATDRYERGQRAEDSAIASIEVAHGVRITLESDLGAPHISANAVVTCAEGMMTIEENHVRVLGAETGGWRTESGAPFGTDDPAVEPDELARPMFELVRHFGTANIGPFVRNYVDQLAESLDWLDGRVASHRGSADQGYRTLEILMAIYESARCREVTAIPVQTRVHPLDLMVESGDLPVRRPGRYDIRSGLVRGEAMSWT